MIFSTADMARQEKETHVERVLSGMQLAKRNGQKFGRKSGPSYTEGQLLRKYAKAVKDLQLGVSIRKVADVRNICRQSAAYTPMCEDSFDTKSIAAGVVNRKLLP